MASRSQVLSTARDQLARRTSSAIATGLSGLDVSGGLLTGQVWLVTGAIGAGRSTLAVQLAAAACESGAATLYVSGRDPLADVVDRLDRLVQHSSQSRSVDPGWQAELPLDLLDFPSRPHGLALFGELERHQGWRVVVIDDVDVYEHDAGPIGHIVPSPDLESGPGMPELLRVWAWDNGATVVVTLPTSPTTGLSGREVPTPWLRAADVVVRIDRPDWDDPGQDGIARLTLVRNRKGPTITTSVAALYDRACFTEIELSATAVARR